ncbi:MAG: thymidylate kinase [Candidatus ainarchaeum sp.]|nr:thymidylate kinase [Candidatus ainarchaeum sp.]
MVQKGKFIVIDGTDGSGKKTQMDLLVNKLISEGKEVKTADFPQYGNWSAEFVARYLRGEFGTLEQVSAKKASLFYALDRFAASFQIREWLNNGVTVISNRYTSSNKGHQLGKIASDKERDAFLTWVNDLEYNILGIPKPDLTLLLHMDPLIGQQLVDKKDAREYTKGKKRDLHEADANHLKNAESAYLFCLENDKSENWKRIVCFEKNKPKSIEEIQKEVYKIVKEIIK